MNDSPKREMESREVEKKVISILDDFSNTLKDVEDLMNQYFEYSDESSPNSVRRINLLSFISKVLEVNTHFLRNFADAYNAEEPTISTTLARGIFELHLILLEATCDDTSFLNVMIKAGDAYESFIEKFLQIAEQKNNVAAISGLHGELVRVALSKKKYERLLKVDLKSKARPHPYLNFKELAEKHGLSEAYDIEYNLLSFFIHPSLLYLITTESRDKTVSEKQRQLSKSNIESRKRLVKSIATYVAFDLSTRTTSIVRKILDDYQPLSSTA
jgi:hypothetical protein